MGWDFEQIFRELPSWITIPMVIFLGILLIIWLLLPLWVLFIQWHTGKIRDEIRYLADQLAKKDLRERRRNAAEPEN